MPRVQLLYQSYHSGIESTKEAAEPEANKNYQSYHSGIESLMMALAAMFVGSINRTILELKENRKKTMKYQLLAINRTILELKGDATLTAKAIITPINRTILELKVGSLAIL